MALNLFDAIYRARRRFKSGIQEVREGLPLARSGFQSLKRDVGKAVYKKRPQKPVSPEFLKKPLARQLVSREVGARAATNVGNVFAKLVGEVESLATTEEQARKQLLTKIPRTDRYFDPS